MRKTIVACTAAAFLIAVGSSIVRSEGLNLSWDDCGSFGVGNKAFSCDVNDAALTLVASFVRDDPDSAYGAGGTLIFDAAPALLPDWWKFPDNSPLSNPPGACQDSGNLVHDPGEATSCEIPFVDDETVASYGWSGGSGTMATFNFTSFSTSTTEAFLTPGVEYAYLRLILHPARTIGPEACAGCNTPMTITLTRAVLIRDSPNYQINDPAIRNVVTWDGLPTPVLPTTWGRIKRLYR